MKYSKITIAIVALIFLAACKTPLNEEVPEPEVYFTSEVNMTKKMIELFDSADNSIHCALYDLDNLELIKKIDEKSEELDVKVVMDDDNYISKKYIKKDSDGLMHNKFCIIDGKVVWTGSYNPTYNGNRNDNNVIILFSRLVAEQYEEEFQEMWKGTYKSGTANKIKETKLNNNTYKILFCPEDACEENVLKELNKAENNIYFMTFSFTSKPIADKLIEKQKQGVLVEGVMEKQRVTHQYNKYTHLIKNGVNVAPDKNKYILHHKVFIIDNKTLITGSYNPTGNGDKRNDENMIITNDPAVVQEYLEEFERVWNE